MSCTRFAVFCNTSLIFKDPEIKDVYEEVSDESGEVDDEWIEGAGKIPIHKSSNIRQARVSRDWSGLRRL